MHQFVNAQEMHEKNPDTFEAPTQKELDSIGINTSVKICHMNERFWVTITEVGKDTVTGVVDNELVQAHPFKFGDTIQFKKHHICSIFN